MANYDTTATAEGDTYIADDLQTSTFASLSQVQIRSLVAPQNRRAIISLRVPDKPNGADRINTASLVLSVAVTVGAAPTMHVYTMDRLWTEQASWGGFDTASSWSKPGGDLVTQIGTALVSRTAGLSVNASTFSVDVSRVGIDWGKHFSVILKDASESAAADRTKAFWSINTVATYVGKPHVVVNFADDPPARINDLKPSPDLSLSEASYTYRQRAVLTWSASSESDFKRYRIRKGVNRSQASDHSHLVFINSRASTTYIDATLYSDGSSIFYSIYPEDRRNGSTSTSLGATYVNVSNIASWTKPDAIIGSMSIGSSASTLQEIEVRIRATTMANAKKAKIIWGDGGWSMTQSLTSAGGYLYARHRYTKATSGYTIRALIEDIYGFRSSLDSYGTSVTISNLGPVAKIAASPTRTKTAGTFSFGNSIVSGGAVVSRALFLSTTATFVAPADGVGLSFKFTGNNPVATLSALLLRDEGAYYRVIYSDSFTAGTVSVLIRRNINWRINKGDILGYLSTGPGLSPSATQTSGRQYRAAISSASTISVGDKIPKYRFASQSTMGAIGVSLAYTNPVFFTAKDSFARGSNRFINRFRWAPGYAADFGAAYATGGSYITGATTSFYYGWTTATTQFVAVRAVDDQNASSIDHIGVIVETEATFRIPDELRDKVTDMSDNRSRAYTFQPTLGRDYGVLDMASIPPVTINVRGESYSMGTNNTWIDIDRISAAFQQRKKIFILPPWSTSTYVNGYILDPPVTRSASKPMVKEWQAKIAVIV